MTIPKAIHKSAYHYNPGSRVNTDQPVRYFFSRFRSVIHYAAKEMILPDFLQLANWLQDQAGNTYKTYWGSEDSSVVTGCKHIT